MRAFFKYTLACLLLFQFGRAGNFNSGYLQMSQPNSATFSAKIWGDEEDDTHQVKFVPIECATLS